MDINKIVVSNNVSFGKKFFKYFVRYKEAKNIKTLLYIYSKDECI